MGIEMVLLAAAIVETVLAAISGTGLSIII
jgi:hypothetical protein